MKTKIKRRIELAELEGLKEAYNRAFEVSYVEQGGATRLYKRFRNKRNVRKYIDDPYCTKIKLYVCEMV